VSVNKYLSSFYAFSLAGGRTFALPMKTPRLHSLDSLRAIMMLLGLVLHSALTYNVTGHGDAWSLKDPNATHLATDFLTLLIHAFRMPTFFMIAGFFGALLFYERGRKKMIANRIFRIVFPFLVFLFVLFPFTVLAFTFSQEVFANQMHPLSATFRFFVKAANFIPNSTFHLWFLYYLTLITACTVLLAIMLRRAPLLTSKTTAAFCWILPHPALRILSFTALTYGLLLVLGTSMVNPSNRFVPELNTFLFYGLFYLVGWLLYRAKAHLPTLVRGAWTCTLLGLLLVITQGLVIQYGGLDLNLSDPAPILLLFSSLVVWLFVFGITGLFLRYGGNYSPVMRYVSDASYWVYLVHLPLTVFFPGVIAGWEIPALAKFLIVLTLTTLLCFVSYHYLVRASFIGRFLNGRRYPQKLQQAEIVVVVGAAAGAKKGYRPAAHDRTAKDLPQGSRSPSQRTNVTL
jgi:glucan biosynthesis protein C